MTSPPAPATRVVVLGASNVQIGLAPILRLARTITGGPVDLFAALGHGRSFGRSSSIPGRTLPAILECRLWEDLAERPAAPMFSLITDIGNDLLYGRSPERTAAWVAECVDRLAEYGPVTLTGLPIDNLASLSEWRYKAFRTLFFPAYKVSLAELADQARDLHQRIEALALERSCRFVTLDTEWYGFDPIHYRLSSRNVVWRSLLGAAIDPQPCETETFTEDANRRGPSSFLERARLWLSVPVERKVLGFHRRCPQPCAVLGDGSRVSLY